VIGGLNRSTQRYRRRADCNGVPQAAELQELDAWKAEQTVKRYAHFAPEQLRAAADGSGASAECSTVGVSFGDSDD
jgi:hypothetical protein